MLWYAWKSRSVHGFTQTVPAQATTLLLTSQGLWPHLPTSSPVLPVLPGSWALTFCLSEPRGSAAGLLTLIIHWILGTSSKTWFCTGPTAPHGETTGKRRAHPCRSGEGNEQKEMQISKRKDWQGHRFLRGPLDCPHGISFLLWTWARY